ncbi:MAG: DUF4388 domain-containing protein [Actinomycetota bacterium]
MLKGTLDDFTLPDIFRLMSLARKTGALEVQRSAGNGKVYFRDGEVYFAESSLTRTPLGQKLVRSGVITETQLMKALDLHKEKGLRLGDVLVAEDIVSREELLEAVRSQIEDAAFDLLRWDLGEFAWESGEGIEPEVPIMVSVENLIMEASRRLDELEIILRKIPSEHAILGMAAAPPVGAVEINITPEEWRILVQVNGERSVAEIAESLDVETLDAMKSLYGMVSTGLIEVVGGVPEGWQPPTEEPPAEEEEPELEEASSPFEPESVSSEIQPEVAPAEIRSESVSDEAPPERDEAGDPFAAELLSDEPVERPTRPDAADVDVEAEAELIREGAEPAVEREEEESKTGGTAVEEARQAAEKEPPKVDRIAAVRELSGLFREEGEQDDARPAFRGNGGGSDAPEDEPDQRRRVEDDELVTKSLISKLISGVQDL